MPYQQIGGYAGQTIIPGENLIYRAEYHWITFFWRLIWCGALFVLALFTFSIVRQLDAGVDAVLASISVTTPLQNSGWIASGSKLGSSIGVLLVGAALWQLIWLAIDRGSTE